MPLDPSTSEEERTLVFGAEGNLAGTLTLPAGSQRQARHAVLLTNVGLMPRCGPYRLNVEMARRFAQHGVASLRFDLSGLGDSTHPSNALALMQQWVLDTRAAMDAAERELGVREFVMIGVCSGADVAFVTAPQDPRLRGLVLFDPYIYPTRRTAVLGLLYRLRALGPVTTLRLMVNRLARIARRRLQAQASQVQAEEGTLRYGPSAPSLDEFAGTLGAIVDGGARVLLLYSGSYPYYYNYDGQTADNLRPYGLDEQVESAMIRESDHVLMGYAGRQRFIERSLEAVSRWFGVAQVADASAASTAAPAASVAAGALAAPPIAADPAAASASPRREPAWEPALEGSRCLL
jgi:dienelactone hydrolase